MNKRKKRTVRTNYEWISEREEKVNELGMN